MTAGDEAPAGSLDVDHLADLANLPLDADEHDELAEACREVLATFQLDTVEEPEEDEASLTPFPDEADPWPAKEIEAILAAFPDRDGRDLRA